MSVASVHLRCSSSDKVPNHNVFAERYWNWRGAYFVSLSLAGQTARTDC